MSYCDNINLALKFAALQDLKQIVAHFVNIFF